MFQTNFYNYIEPTSSTSDDFDELRITSSSFCEVILLRVLLGTAKIEDKKNFKTIYSKCNYCTLGNPTNDRITQNFVKSLFCDTYDKELLSKYFSQNARNTDFYRNLLFEISQYIFYQDKKSYATAFLHLYRITEYISYTFPLLFAAKSGNYQGTYNDLKKFFGDNNGELGFFRHFQEAFVDDSTILNMTANITFAGEEAELEAIKKYFEQINVNKNINFEKIDEGRIEIKYRYLFSLVINIRNSYFHMKNGDSAFCIRTEHFNVETFLEQINPYILNWIGYIYFQIFSFGLGRTV